MSKEYSRVLGELVTVHCPLCKSETYSFKRPVVTKGSIVLPCMCSDCKLYFTVAYKAYEIEYNNGKAKITLSVV